MQKLFSVLCMTMVVLTELPVFSYTLHAQQEENMDSESHKPDLILYYKPTCPYCVKVLKFLKSINKELSLKDIAADETAKEELIHLGGKKQVPCLFIDGTPLYESSDIIEWLESHQELLN